MCSVPAVILFLQQIQLTSFCSLLHVGAEDAFDIGRKTYLQSKHDITTGWMREALRLLEVNRGVNDGAPTRYEVLDHLAWSEYVVCRIFLFV